MNRARLRNIVGELDMVDLKLDETRHALKDLKEHRDELVIELMQEIKRDPEQGEIFPMVGKTQ